MSLITSVFILIATLDASNALAQAEPFAVVEDSPFDHSSWATVLSECVSPEGRFAYDRLLNSAELTERFEAYLLDISTASLSVLNDKERLAFWINAYNAITVRGVIEHYPVDSVFGLAGFFDRARYTVAGYELSLNDIENDQIRAVFQEPRAHFAMNCASLSCPPLRSEPFTGARLDLQLEEQARAFIVATTEVDTNEMEIRLNKIFEWFGGDFDRVGGVREFVAQRMPEPAVVRNERNIITFRDYDWGLNVP